MINPQKPDFQNTPAHPARPTPAYCLLTPGQAPVVSIVTPFYNTGEVFHQTARSIFNQTLQQWEWLVVNDGSQEEQALALLEQYRRSDPRIRVIDHVENRGLSAARNTGIAQTRCEFVVLLDSDDLLEPTAIEKWWWFLQAQPQYAFVASYHVAFEGQSYLWSGGFHDGVQNTERNRVSMMLMLRKSVHQAVGGFDETIRGGLEDWEYWMRCADHGFWGATIPEYLAWYRTRSQHTDRWRNLSEERITAFRAGFQKKYPRLYQGGFPNPVSPLDIDLGHVSLDYPAVNRLAKDRSRLLLLLPWMVMGGAERFALNLLDQLHDRGWQTTIVCTAPSDHPWLPEFARRTADFFILPNFLPLQDFPRFLGYLVESRQFDAALLQGSIEAYRLLPTLRALLADLPILDYLHFVTPNWMDGGFPRLSLLYRDSIDRTLTSCQQVRQWMIEQGADPQNLQVCPINVDTQQWRPDATARAAWRERLAVSESETLIIYAARLETQKQPLTFIETLRLLASKGSVFRAVIAGDGSLRAMVAESIHAAGLDDKIQLLGAIDSAEMPGLLNAGDIFFLPSQNEGVSSALYEAMSCGLPILSVNVGGQAELVSPECGILLPPEAQPADYAQALAELVKHPEQRQSMGAAGRQRVLSHFTLAHMGDCLESSLQETIRFKRDHLLPPQSLSPAERLTRDTRHVVEYLHARQQLRDLNQQHTLMTRQFYDLVQPKPASHWFYLWIRQLFLPLYQHFKGGSVGVRLDAIKTWLKQRLRV